MLIGTLVLLSSSLLHTTPASVFAEVYIGAEGPYRFLADTGAETSLIDPKLAAALRLTPEFRVNVITQNSTQLSRGMKARNLHIGETALRESELIFYDVRGGAAPRPEDARRAGAQRPGGFRLYALARNRATGTDREPARRRSGPVTVDMFFDRLRIPMLAAERKGSQADGLLPASVFQKIHVDQTRGEIVLLRRQ
jgi:hypothetical protein